MGASEGILLGDAGQRKRLARKAGQQHVMRGDRLTNMLGGLLIAHAAFMAQGDIANIGVEMMLVRVAVPVGLIGPHGVLVPLAGKYALSADSFKTVPNTADTGKQIDKPEGIVRVRGRRSRKQVLQITKLAFTQATPCSLAGQQTFKDRRAPVAFAVCHQQTGQRFSIIDIQQLAK